MVGVPHAAVRTPRNYRVRTQTLELLSQSGRYAVQQCRVPDEIAKPPIWELQEDRRLQTQRLGCALGFADTKLSQLRARRDSCIDAALRAIGDDKQMYPNSLASIAGQHGADRALVVRVCRYDK
jgi:hypothetical protein